METFFTTAEHHQIDFIKMLLSRAPNLNSLQIIERTRSRFGVYPSKSVTKWLHARMSGLTTSRDDVVAWGQGAQALKRTSTANHKLHTQDSNTGKGAESHIVQPPQVVSPLLREKVRGTPWDRKVYVDRAG